MTQLTAKQRDIVTRTVMGEALPNSTAGMQAVANVIKNRADSGRFPSDPAAVALQHHKMAHGTVYQFTAWSPTQGNKNVYLPATSSFYKRAASIVDQVFGGELPDNTRGALYYYNPDVAATPAWWAQNAPYGGVKIGGNLFATRYSSEAAAASASGTVGATEAATAAKELDPQTQQILQKYQFATAPGSPLDAVVNGEAGAFTAPSGNKYVAGQEYRLPDGATYRANTDGSFSKVANTPRTLTPVQLYFESQSAEAQKNLQNEGRVLSQATSAAGSFLGKLWNGITNPSTPPPSLTETNWADQYYADPRSSTGAQYDMTPEQLNQYLGAYVPEALHPVQTNDVAQELASADPTTGDRATQLASANSELDWAAPYLSTKFASPPLNGYDPTSGEAWAAPYWTTPADPASTDYSTLPWAYGWAPLAPADPNQPPPADVPPTKPISAKPTVVNDPITGNSVAMPRTPAQQAQAASPVPLYLGMNGYVYSGSPQAGYTRVGPVNPTLSPAAQYAVGAAPALISQPNGDPFGSKLGVATSGFNLRTGGQGGQNASSAAQQTPGGSLATPV